METSPITIVLVKSRDILQKSTNSGWSGGSVNDQREWIWCGSSPSYSPVKWLQSSIRIYCHSNRSKQMQETHTAYSAFTQYSRQSLNEIQHIWLHRQQPVACLTESFYKGSKGGSVKHGKGNCRATRLRQLNYTHICVHALNRTTGQLLVWSHLEEYCLEARCIATQIPKG